MTIDTHPAAGSPTSADLAATVRTALACLDPTSLNHADTEADIARLCARADRPFGATAAVCVWPRFAAFARARRQRLLFRQELAPGGLGDRTPQRQPAPLQGNLPGRNIKAMRCAGSDRIQILPRSGVDNLGVPALPELVRLRAGLTAPQGPAG